MQPTSKIIQISTLVQNRKTKTFIINQKEPVKTEIDEVAILVALCENGSIWQLLNNKWECILEANNDKDK